jgi:hypothetical protein
MEVEDLNLENVAQPDREMIVYEFTMAQNATIKVLADRMKFIGVLYLACAVFVAFAGIDFLLCASLMSIGFFSMVAFFGFIGWWTYKGSVSLQAIVQTKGNDVMHLMDALEDLRKIYNGTFWLMIVVLTIWLIGILITGILLA